MSTPNAPRNSPVSPPIRNSPRNPNAYSIGVSNEIDPPNSVAVQLNVLIADGIATINVKNENATAAYVDWPVTNIWCVQTRNPITAIAKLAPATKLSPNIHFLPTLEFTSSTTHNPSRT